MDQKRTTDNTDDSDKEKGVKDDKFLYKELTGDIIGAAMDVLNALRPGLDEKIYENALVLELSERGHQSDFQFTIEDTTLAHSSPI